MKKLLNTDITTVCINIFNVACNKHYIFKKWIQVLECPWNHEYFRSLTKYSWFHEHLLLIFTFYYNYLKYKIIYNLRNKTVLHLICNCINSFVGVKPEQRNSKCEHWQWMEEQTRGLFCTCNSVWLAVNHNNSVTSGEQFHVLSMLHRQVILAAVNQICVIHEAMKDCKNLKIQ